MADARIDQADSQLGDDDSLDEGLLDDTDDEQANAAEAEVKSEADPDTPCNSAETENIPFIAAPKVECKIGDVSSTVSIDADKQDNTPIPEVNTQKATKTETRVFVGLKRKPSNLPQRSKKVKISEPVSGDESDTTDDESHSQSIVDVGSIDGEQFVLQGMQKSVKSEGLDDRSAQETDVKLKNEEAMESQVEVNEKQSEDDLQKPKESELQVDVKQSVENVDVELKKEPEIQSEMEVDKKQSVEQMEVNDDDNDGDCGKKQLVKTVDPLKEIETNVKVKKERKRQIIVHSELESFVVEGELLRIGLQHLDDDDNIFRECRVIMSYMDCENVYDHKEMLRVKAMLSAPTKVFKGIKKRPAKLPDRSKYKSQPDLKPKIESAKPVNKRKGEHRNLSKDEITVVDLVDSSEDESAKIKDNKKPKEMVVPVPKEVITIDDDDGKKMDQNTSTATGSKDADPVEGNKADTQNTGDRSINMDHPSNVTATDSYGSNLNPIVVPDFTRVNRRRLSRRRKKEKEVQTDNTCIVISSGHDKKDKSVTVCVKQKDKVLQTDSVRPTIHKEVEQQTDQSGVADNTQKSPDDDGNKILTLELEKEDITLPINTWLSLIRRVVVDVDRQREHNNSSAVIGLNMQPMRSRASSIDVGEKPLLTSTPMTSAIEDNLDMPNEGENAVGRSGATQNQGNPQGSVSAASGNATGAEFLGGNTLKTNENTRPIPHVPSASSSRGSTPVPNSALRTPTPTQGLPTASSNMVVAGLSPEFMQNQQQQLDMYSGFQQGTIPSVNHPAYKHYLQSVQPHAGYPNPQTNMYMQPPLAAHTQQQTYQTPQPYIRPAHTNPLNYGPPQTMSASGIPPTQYPAPNASYPYTAHNQQPLSGLQQQQQPVGVQQTAQIPNPEQTGQYCSLPNTVPGVVPTSEPIPSGQPLQEMNAELSQQNYATPAGDSENAVGTSEGDQEALVAQQNDNSNGRQETAQSENSSNRSGGKRNSRCSGGRSKSKSRNTTSSRAVAETTTQADSLEHIDNSEDLELARDSQGFRIQRRSSFEGGNEAEAAGEANDDDNFEITVNNDDEDDNNDDTEIGGGVDNTLDETNTTAESELNASSSLRLRLSRSNNSTAESTQRITRSRGTHTISEQQSDQVIQNKRQGYLTVSSGGPFTKKKGETSKTKSTIKASNAAKKINMQNAASQYTNSGEMQLSTTQVKSTRQVTAAAGSAAQLNQPGNAVGGQSGSGGGGGGAFMGKQRIKELEFFVYHRQSLDNLRKLLGSAKKRLTEDESKTLLKDYNKVLMTTKKDNNSFFHAISKQLPRAIGGKDLRHEVINHIEDNRRKYEVMINSFTNVTYHEYCQNMVDVSIPYDEILILATADYLGRNITLTHGEGPWDFNPEVDADIVCVIAARNCVYGSRNAKTVEDFSSRRIKMPNPYKCWYCKKNFATLEILKSHQKAHKKKKYPCAQCSKIYASTYSLRQHVNVAHLGKKYICTYDDCRKEFQTVKSYNDHTKYHAKLYNFMCDKCPKGFMKSDHFNVHMMRHDRVKPYSCDLCGKAFFRKHEVKRHLESNCGNPDGVKVQCNICGKYLKNKDSLRNHKKSVHEEGEQYSCPHCPNISTYHSSTVIRHVKKYHSNRLST